MKHETLIEMPWHEMYSLDCCDEMFNKLIHIVSMALEKNAPIGKVFIRTPKTKNSLGVKWFDHECQTQFKLKQGSSTLSRK